MVFRAFPRGSSVGYVPGRNGPNATATTNTTTTTTITTTHYGRGTVCGTGRAVLTRETRTSGRPGCTRRRPATANTRAAWWPGTRPAATAVSSDGDDGDGGGAAPRPPPPRTPAWDSRCPTCLPARRYHRGLNGRARLYHRCGGDEILSRAGHSKRGTTGWYFDTTRDRTFYVHTHTQRHSHTRKHSRPTRERASTAGCRPRVHGGARALATAAHGSIGEGLDGGREWPGAAIGRGAWPPGPEGVSAAAAVRAPPKNRCTRRRIYIVVVVVVVITL